LPGMEHVLNGDLLSSVHWLWIHTASQVSRLSCPTTSLWLESHYVPVWKNIGNQSPRELGSSSIRRYKWVPSLSWDSHLTPTSKGVRLPTQHEQVIYFTMIITLCYIARQWMTVREHEKWASVPKSLGTYQILFPPVIYTAIFTIRNLG